MNDNRLSVGWGVFFVFLYLYRCGMSVLGELVVTRLTSLGDAGLYQQNKFAIIETTRSLGASQIFDMGKTYSTAITQTVGAIFHSVSFGNPILIDFGFQTIAFVGIFKFITAVEGVTRKYLAVLMLTPSFNLWSSVAAKEALVVFFVGALCAFFVRLYRNDSKLGLLEVVSALGVSVYKVHYVPALVAVFLFVIVGRIIRQKVALAIGAGLFSLVPLFLLRDKIDNMAFLTIPHFLGRGSSREAYWVEKYDVFYKAPYGMFQGFFGPTIGESISGPLQMASFLESAFIVGILLLLLVRNLPNIPVFGFVAGVVSLGWLLFASYPLGIMNSGSAVRYRTGHLLLVFLIFTIVFSRDRYITWLGENADRKSGAQLSPHTKNQTL